MKIGLWSDSVGFPSLPLMKLSAYHKEHGDEVKLIDDFTEHFDIAYCSKTFNLPAIKKIPQLEYIPFADKVIFGGSGFAIDVKNGKEIYRKIKDQSLPYEIEHTYPDYGLYPELTKDTAYGFLTRGCPNHCGFCIVSKKEGCKSTCVADLHEFWRGQKHIKLMDANLLACADAEVLIQSLIQSKSEVDFTQGLDARYIDDYTAQLLTNIKISMVHFAFDLMMNEADIIRGLTTFRKYFKKPDRHCKVYILTNYNTSPEEDWYRVREVIELGYRPDVRIYQKGTHSQFLTDLARWANNSRLYRSCSFKDFAPRVDGKKCEEMYQDILKSA